MIGTSLPFGWLKSGNGVLGDREEVLSQLKALGVESAELRTVSPTTDPEAVLEAARLVWKYGIRVTVHASPKSLNSSLFDVYLPLRPLLGAIMNGEAPQKELVITLHPQIAEEDEGDPMEALIEGNANMLIRLSSYAETLEYPVKIALENNRRMPDGRDGDSASMVLEAVRRADRKNVGICFDMGHYAYYVKVHHPENPDLLPPKDFFRRVIHTHIHALNDTNTHFPLSAFELPLDRYVGALCHEYFGAYNIELSYPRFEGLMEPRPALFSSVETLRDAMPLLPRLYDDIRQHFDVKFTSVLDTFRKSTDDNLFTSIGSSAYLFKTGSFFWGMDLSFRNAYQLAQAPHAVGDLLSELSLIIISHSHDDHFEKKTVKRLAKNPTRWVIPDFLEESALSCGIAPDKLILAHPDEPITVGPLTILPFVSRHYRPGTDNGVPEYGYRITAEGAPSMIFPVDVRDFTLETMPEVEAADICFANVWLGDEKESDEVRRARIDLYTDFMLKLSHGTFIASHLYENGRTERGMWQRCHAESIGEAMKTKNPAIQWRIPDHFEIVKL